jgi:hypothetical protein
VSYTASEWRSIEPLARKAVEQAREHPERRDLFLCHAWDDREGSASELYDRLKSNGSTVWFSEKDVALGKQLIREIDKGLRNSRVGIVLVTPALLKSIEAEGIAEKELSVLLASGRVIPVAHGTTFEALRDVSPMLRTPDWTPQSRRWTRWPQRSPPPPQRSPRTTADARRHRLGARPRLVRVGAAVDIHGRRGA